jgi:hypothetical protein
MNPRRINAPKIALAGLLCFLAGAAWTAIVFAEISRRERTPGIGVIVGIPRTAELLFLVGLGLLAFASLIALAKTIRRRLNA